MEIVDKIADSLTDAAPTVASLARLIGAIDEQQSSGSTVRPRDQRISWSFIGSQTVDGHEQPAYVEIQFSPGARVQVRDLTERFGPWQSMTPNPEGTAFRVQFRYDRKGKPATAAIFASLSAEPDSPAAIVEEVTVRRDRR